MTAKKDKVKAVKASAAIPPVKKAAKKETKKADKAVPAKAATPGSKKDLRQQIDTALAAAMAGMQPHFREKEYTQLLKKAGKLFGDALQQPKVVKAPAKAKTVAPKKDKSATAAKATAPAAE